MVLLGFVGWSFEPFFARCAGERHWPSLFAHALIPLPKLFMADRSVTTTNHFSGLWIFRFAELAFRFGCAIGFLEAGRKRLCLLS